MSVAKKNIRKRLKGISLGVILGILLCEIILWIYNPTPPAISKGKLILPANQHKIFSNKWIKKLDEKIYYSKNSLGFRGPELPVDRKDLLSILTIGGSTTECKYLSDSCTWPFRLYEKLKKENSALWLNNAGIDGHTTFGHMMLVKEYVLKLKPKYVLIMTGVNDVELDEPDEFDKMTENKVNTASVKDVIKSLANHSQLGKSFLNYFQLQVSYKKGLIHREINLPNLVDNPLIDSIISLKLNKQQPYLAGYKKRLDSIINMCQQSGITPILITQPSLFGDYTDSATHIAVGNKWLSKDPLGENCLLMQKVLELYNDVLRSFSPKVKMIDLAALMPKKWEYFYDFTHVTNAGAEKQAAILFTELKNITDR